MEKLKIYLLSPKIKFKTFKKLQEKLVKDSGPVPVNGDKILWQMLRDKQIVCGFRSDMPGDMWIGSEIPKNVEISIITDYKK